MWTLARIARLAVAIATLALVVASARVDHFGRAEEPGASPAQAIVVLGARVLEGGVAGGSLRARVERAAELYREGAAPLVVFSGGVGDHPPSEARVARDLAVALSVPTDACMLEEESHSTAENARFTARLLRARSIRRVLLVTDPYHLYRARQSFWAEGIDAHGVPALHAPRNRSAFERAYWTIREVAALLRRPRLLFVRRPPGGRPGYLGD